MYKLIIHKKIRIFLKKVLTNGRGLAIIKTSKREKKKRENKKGKKGSSRMKERKKRKI